MTGYIYRTHNIINGKMYIGKKRSSRFLEDKYLGSGKVLYRSIKKYGRENFMVELLEEISGDKEALNEREKYWISFYKADKSDSYYNIADGGQGGNTLSGMSSDELATFSQKLSRSIKKFREDHPDFQRGEKNPAYRNCKASFRGRHHTEESKKAIREKLRGRIFSEETREKLRGSHKKFSEDTKRRMSESAKKRMSDPRNNPSFGKKCSESTRRKISESLTGRHLSDETVRKILESRGINPHVHNEETKRRMSECKKGRKKVTKDGVRSEFVKKEDLEKYLDNGFVLWKDRKTLEEKDEY